MVYLLDGSSYLYRAYYTIPYMSSPDGTPTNIVYGFARMLKAFMREFEPTHFGVVWDTRSEISQKRLNWYPEYKANREVPPEELDNQRDLVKELVAALGIAQFERTDEEADDILFTLARQYAQQDTVTIISPDKDLLQTVTTTISVYRPFKKDLVTPAVIRQLYGLPPEKLVFYFSLVGDSTDNIPGVKGIGPARALPLVTTYDSLAVLYQQLDTVENKHIQKLLKEGEKEAFLSQQLFQLYDLPIESSYEECKVAKAL